MDFNLLDKEWIPVLYRDGRWGRVGIRKALQDAGRIRQIAASNPMDRIAILRFLLALLYWCKKDSPDEGSTDSVVWFPSEWFARLDDNKECFNLLGDAKRFYQDRTAQRTRAVTDLIQEIPTGNNFWHFRHATDMINGLCPVCCVLGLLRLPLFSVSGLPDLKAGINGTPPVYVVPWGMSLRETLQANWSQRANLGVPAWVQPDVRPIPGEDVPLLTGLTLLSRRVFLHDPVERPGVCIGCGTRETPLILTCEYQTAGKQENALWDDPHAVYSDTTPRKTVKAPDMTAARKFRMDRPWPDLLARIVETGGFGSEKKAPSLFIVGFATDQAKNIDAWERTIAVPPGKPIREMSASLLQQWRKEGWRMEKRIGRSEVEGSATMAAIRPDIEGRVSAKAGELIVGDDEGWQQAAEEYRPMMGMIAESLSPGFTAAAVQGRRHVIGVKPDMRPKRESAKKPGQKKRGDK
jgi:CRISPR type I-E-associated protein CasA/Cse1